MPGAGEFSGQFRAVKCICLMNQKCSFSTEVSRMAIGAGTEAARPFLPAKDFDTSKRFYEMLGFKKLLDGDVAIFAAGQTAFILQRQYDKKWAEQTMMQLMVDDLDQWGAH